MRRYIIGIILIIALVIIILGGDAALPLLNLPTISETLVFWTNVTPLVPVLVGYSMGLLTMHLFERYFIKDPEFHWFRVIDIVPPRDRGPLLYSDGTKIIREVDLYACVPSHWGYQMKLPEQK